MITARHGQGAAFQEIGMAADGVQQEGANGTEFVVHKRNYDGFLKVLKRSTIAVVIVAAIVIFIISR